MSGPIPFSLDTRDASQVRAFNNDMNRPVFLERSASVSLYDQMPPAIGEEGLIPTDSLGGQVPGIVASQTNSTALGTTAFAQNVLRAVLFKQGHAYRMSLLGINVTTSAASSTMRLGIYDCVDDLHGNFYPNRLLFGSASTLSGASTGIKSETPNLELAPNRAYWAVYNCADGGSGVPTINSLAVAAAGVGIGTGGGTPTPYISVAFTFAAMPQTFPTGAAVATTVPPMIYREYTASSGHVTTTQVPVFSPTSNGYSLRRVRLLRSSDSTAESGARPYNVVRIGIGTTVGFRELARFDTRKNAQKARSPYLLYPGPDVVLSASDTVEVQAEQYGWPKKALVGTTVQADYIYTGAP